jgi:hypothetical protein
MAICSRSCSAVIAPSLPSSSSLRAPPPPPARAASRAQVATPVPTADAGRRERVLPLERTALVLLAALLLLLLLLLFDFEIGSGTADCDGCCSAPSSPSRTPRSAAVSPARSVTPPWRTVNVQSSRHSAVTDGDARHAAALADSSASRRCV